MIITNPRHNKHGTIDCEIDHPVYGLIPFTADPDDVELLGQETHAAILAGDAGPIAPYTQTQEEIDAEAAALAAATATAAKMTGVLFDGVMCSAKSEDMYGLAAVAPYVRQGMDIPPFIFANGNKLKLTTLNIDAFELVWIPFRASFFS